uniref:Uncharacterized protein n=1 Tax=Musca domestica TaxID=7370 RepID=A0A1I8MV89_MUSDO
MHTEQHSHNNTNNVELLSIKIKSPQHIDQEIETSSAKNRKWQQFVDQRYGSKISDRNNNNLNNSNNNSNCDAGVDDDNNKNDNNDYDDDDDHYESAVRLLQIDKTVNGSCGFHLTRSKWDPYPWVVCLHLDDDVENLITQSSLCVCVNCQWC